ncbi:MAG: tetratricopeptide repeat protein [Flavobacteriales bacterium]|nr:tetratricopeptide repeat protein [Flavobacteriales bacterium]MCB9363465.1 tetratricopeptide repeat protein [Flavobacteriales bacterium]
MKFNIPLYKSLLAIIFIVVSIILHAETSEKKLKNNLANAKGGKDSIFVFIDLSDHYRFTRPEKGLVYAKKALLLSQKVQDTMLMVKSANKLAILEKENNDNTSALRTILKSLNWAKELGKDTLIANTQLVAGHVYSNLQKVQSAIYNYKKCLKFFKSVNDSSGISYTYSGLGIVYYDNKKYDEALNNYLNAEIYWANNETALKADLWNNIGALYIEKNDFENARYYYNKALSFYKSENWLSEVSMVYYNLGELFLKENKAKNAKECFNKSLSIGKKIGSDTEIIWAYHGLYLTAKKAKQVHQALKYYEQYTHLKDSIHNIQNQEEVKELEALFNQEKQLKKIKDQQLKIVQSEKRVEREKFKNLIFIAFIIFIMILLVLGFFHFQKSKKQNKALKEHQIIIGDALKEKELLLKEIHHRVKNNLQVISSLLNLQHNAVDNELTRYVIDETQHRINAIALVHQKLYQSQNIGQIDFGSYLTELVEQQRVIYKNEEMNVNCIVNAPTKIELHLDIAVSLGLIVSELITNAFKYAFNDRKNNILTVSLSILEDNQYQLVIRDNGIGLPPEFEKGETESLGMDLVKILTEQIDGKLNIKNDNGAYFSITFRNS